MIPMLLNIKLPGFKDLQLYVSIEDSYSEIARFLERKNIPDVEIGKYIVSGLNNHLNGCTTIFKDQKLILIKINSFKNNPMSIYDLEKETLHASRIIVELYDLNNKKEYENYLSGYILRDVLNIVKPDNLKESYEIVN